MRILALGLAVAGLWLGGCSVAQTLPKPEQPFGEIESEERGIVAAVNDTMMDLRTGKGQALHTQTPTVPLGGIIGVSVPVTIGGEKRRDVPGEESTVRLPSGQLVWVVQALSSPPFAVGEQVRILHEKPHYITGESRTRVARVE
jgi:hypothetical protein